MRCETNRGIKDDSKVFGLTNEKSKLSFNEMEKADGEISLGNAE